MLEMIHFTGTLSTLISCDTLLSKRLEVKGEFMMADGSEALTIPVLLFISFYCISMVVGTF